MNTSIQNCMVAQSGGPTVAINASLAGVIKGAAGCYGTVYGSVNGILGILNEHYLNLSEIMEADDNALERLIHTPAMYLGSCRFKLPDFMDDDSIRHRGDFAVYGSAGYADRQGHLCVHYL